MLKVLAIAVGVLAAGPASAGCEDFTDGSMTTSAPAAEVCFKGKCDQTTVDVTCGNATGAFSIYANGWRVDQFVEDGQDKIVVTYRDKIVSKSLETLVVDGQSFAEMSR